MLLTSPQDEARVHVLVLAMKQKTATILHQLDKNTKHTEDSFYSTDQGNRNTLIICLWIFDASRPFVVKLPSALVWRALLHLLLANTSKQKKKAQKMCLWECSFVLNMLPVNWLVFVVFPLLLEDIARFCFFFWVYGQYKGLKFSFLLLCSRPILSKWRLIFFLIKRPSRKTKKQWWMGGCETQGVQFFKLSVWRRNFHCLMIYSFPLKGVQVPFLFVITYFTT